MSYSSQIKVYPNCPIPWLIRAKKSLSCNLLPNSCIGSHVWLLGLGELWRLAYNFENNREKCLKKIIGKKCCHCYSSMVRSAVWQIQHERCDRESHTCSMRRSQVLYELSRPHHECCICHTAHRNHAVTDILYAWVDQRISIINYSKFQQCWTVWTYSIVCHAIYFIQHSKILWSTHATYNK